MLLTLFIYYSKITFLAFAILFLNRPLPGIAFITCFKKICIRGINDSLILLFYYIFRTKIFKIF